MDVEIKGLDKVKMQLVELMPAAMREEVEKAMIKGADKVVKLAQTMVPIDTGELRSTIKRTDVRVGKKGNLYVAISAGNNSTRVGTNNDYQLARIVEYGTHRSAQPARPFLHPAYRTAKNSVVFGIRKAIRDGIKKVMKE